MLFTDMSLCNNQFTMHQLIANILHIEQSPIINSNVTNINLFQKQQEIILEKAQKHKT